MAAESSSVSVISENSTIIETKYPKLLQKLKPWMVFGCVLGILPGYKLKSHSDADDASEWTIPFREKIKNSWPSYIATSFLLMLQIRLSAWFIGE
jgi:hypothetical protein